MWKVFRLSKYLPEKHMLCAILSKKGAFWERFWSIGRNFQPHHISQDTFRFYMVFWIRSSYLKLALFSMFKLSYGLPKCRRTGQCMWKQASICKIVSFSLHLIEKLFYNGEKTDSLVCKAMFEVLKYGEHFQLPESRIHKKSFRNVLHKLLNKSPSEWPLSTSFVEENWKKQYCTDETMCLALLWFFFWLIFSFNIIKRN